jgi:glucokinase
VLTYGLDIGGTNMRAAAVDADGSVLAERRCPTPDTLEALVDDVARLVEEVRAEHPGGFAVGAGVAALIDAWGLVHYAPNIPPLRDVPLGALIAQRVGLPVIIDNDANVAAYGEMRHGAAAAMRSGLVVTLGTGIGGGILVDGHLFRGGHGFAAEIGHFTVLPGGPLCACGARGHWEAMASGNALGRMAREHVEQGALPAVLAAAGGDPSRVNGHAVGEAALAGDASARALIGEYAGWVALGLAGLANILDPERIVIGGGLVTLGPMLFEPLRERFVLDLEGAAHRPPIEIVPAALGEHAGIVGAAALARDEPGRG